MNLAGLAVRRRTTFIMIFLLLTGAGLFATTQLGIDYFPKVDLGMVFILTVQPGAGPLEMEGLVTELIEDAVSGVEGIETVLSNSKYGLSVVTLEMTNSADIDQAESDIRDAVDRMKSQLPDGSSDPLIWTMSSSMKPLVMVTFSSEVMNGAELRSLIEDEITPRLSRIEGVSSVDLEGGQIRQINVEIDPVLLSETGIPLAQIYTALNMVSGNQPGGDIEDGDMEFAVSVQSGFEDINSIRELAIGVHEGRPVSLDEVADIIDSYQEPRNYIYINQGEAVLAIFRKSSDANTVNTCRKLESAIDEVASEYSGTLDCTIIYSQQGFIMQSINDLLRTGIQAVFLAAAVLTLFLGSISNAGIVSLSMPISFIASFAAMYLLGVNLNIMSLAGLSISIGMIVDNSVVVLENIHRWRREGEGQKKAAEHGASQVGMAVTASTLTTVAVFIPMLFVPGMTGQIFRDLSITIAVALFISLFVSQSLIPLLASGSKRLIKEHSKRSISSRIQHRLNRLEERYSRTVYWMTGHTRFVFIPVALLFAGSLFMMRFIPSTFLPEPKEGVIDIDINLAPGTGLEFTDSIFVEIENSVLDLIEPGDLSNSYMSVGRNEGMGAVFGSSTSSSGSLELYFPVEGERSKSIEEYDTEIREVLEQFPGITFSLSSGMPIGNEFPINIVIYGSDLEELRSIGETVSREMTQIPGTADVSSSLRNRMIQVDFIPSDNVLLLRGQSPARLGKEITIGVLGLDAASYTEDSKQYDINLHYREDSRSTMEEIAGLVAYGLPLDAWGSFRNTLVPEDIGRRNRSRSVSVTCRILDRPLGEVATDVEIMMDTLDLSGNRYEILGDIKDKGEAFGSMALAIIVAIILVYMVMASQFESLLEPFIIMVEIPLAMIGVIWTLLLTGTTMGLTSIIGLLMLTGIVVNNGIVFIDFANKLRRESGMSSREAIVLAGRKRLRPILMTTFTTILALMPLSIAATDSSVMWAPMARTVSGGLAVATFFTLVVLPCLYVKLDHWHRIRNSD